MRTLLVAILIVTVAGCGSTPRASDAPSSPAPAVRQLTRATTTMELGNFSVSLAVKDLAASRAFYEKLGFSVITGDASQNWLIMQNGACTIGLFQGMFEKNMLTFNPGWDRSGSNLDSFTDIREIQRRLKASGIALQTEADETTTGPASLMILDPDGNPILIDQHR